MGKLVLIVEDEKAIADIVKYNLVKSGYEVIEAYDGESGLELALKGNPDIVLLDVMLPKMDGFEICKKIREAGNTVPIIMLTAREEEADRVLGLELGADDYVTKPFLMRELVARVKANIRRSGMSEEVKATGDIMRIGALVIDSKNCEVHRDEKRVDLTAREFELLKFLAASPDTVFSRDELMEKVWNYGYVGDVRTVDVTVRRLREKLERDPAEPEYIITKRGMGYFFAAPK